MSKQKKAEPVEAVTTESIEARVRTHADAVGLDPATIALLLQILAAVAGGCLKQRTPEEVVEMARNHPRLTKIALADAMRRVGVKPRNWQATMKVLQATVSEATPAAVHALTSGPAE